MQGNTWQPLGFGKRSPMTTQQTSSYRPPRSITPSTNRDDMYVDEPPAPVRHPIGWVPVPANMPNPHGYQWMPPGRQRIPPYPNEPDHGMPPDWRIFGCWQPPANVPVRPPSPENIAGPSNIQPAQQGPRRTGRVRQPKQQPENVYGTDPVHTESLTDAAWRRLYESENPQGPSRCQAQFTTGNGDSSYVSSKPVLYEAKDHNLDFKLITEEGGEDLINFLLTQSTKRIPPSRHQQPSGIKLPDPAHVRKWAYKDILRFPGKQQEEWRPGRAATMYHVSRSTEDIQCSVLYHSTGPGRFLPGSLYVVYIYTLDIHCIVLDGSTGPARDHICRL